MSKQFKDVDIITDSDTRIENQITQEQETAEYKKNIVDSSETISAKLRQIERSQNLKTSIFEDLHMLNQGSYIFSLYVEDYMRNNIKDASLLKNVLREKVLANLGD